MEKDAEHFKWHDHKVKNIPLFSNCAACRAAPIPRSSCRSRTSTFDATTAAPSQEGGGGRGRNFVSQSLLSCSQTNGEMLHGLGGGGSGGRGEGGEQDRVTQAQQVGWNHDRAGSIPLASFPVTFSVLLTSFPIPWE